MRKNALYRLVLFFAFTACLLVSAFGIGCSVAESQGAADNGIPAVKVEGVPAQKYVPESETDSSRSPFDSHVNQSDENLVVRFIDVGQGDAALVTCDGKSLLIDGGPSDASSKIYTVLKNLGIAHLDYIIATHPDADHCGGIAGALNYASCGTFYSSVDDYDTKTFKSIIRYLGSTPVTIPVEGDSFQLGGAIVEFVAPVVRSDDSNNDSLVCKISLGERSFLFTGDAELESEALLVGSGSDIDVDVLKVGHHGSDSSTSEPFLDATTPLYAIISVGNNNYGHPTQTVIQRLTADGIEIFRTDELGTIIFETDGEGLSVTHSKGLIER